MPRRLSENSDRSEGRTDGVRLFQEGWGHPLDGLSSIGKCNRSACPLLERAAQSSYREYPSSIRTLVFLATVSILRKGYAPVTHQDQGMGGVLLRGEPHRPLAVALPQNTSGTLHCPTGCNPVVFPNGNARRAEGSRPSA